MKKKKRHMNIRLQPQATKTKEEAHIEVGAADLKEEASTMAANIHKETQPQMEALNNQGPPMA